MPGGQLAKQISFSSTAAAFAAGGACAITGAAALAAKFLVVEEMLFPVER